MASSRTTEVAGKSRRGSVTALSTLAGAGDNRERAGGGMPKSLPKRLPLAQNSCHWPAAAVPAEVVICCPQDLFE